MDNVLLTMMARHTGATVTPITTETTVIDLPIHAAWSTATTENVLSMAAHHNVLASQGGPEQPVIPILTNVRMDLVIVRPPPFVKINRAVMSANVPPGSTAMAEPAGPDVKMSTNVPSACTTAVPNPCAKTKRAASPARAETDSRATRQPSNAKRAKVKLLDNVAM